MSQTNWENDEAIDFRTKLALKVLFLIFKVLSPYKFEHRFEEDIKRIEDDIASVK